MSPRPRTSGRKSWNITELNCAKTLFSENIQLNETPSLSECSIAIENNHELSHRSPAQLKAWIHNQITKKKRDTQKTKGKTTLNHAIKCFDVEFTFVFVKFYLKKLYL